MTPEIIRTGDFWGTNSEPDQLSYTPQDYFFIFIFVNRLTIKLKQYSMYSGIKMDGTKFPVLQYFPVVNLGADFDAILI